MRFPVFVLLACALALVLPACDTTSAVDSGMEDTGIDAGPRDSGIDARDVREPDPDVVMTPDTGDDGGIDAPDPDDSGIDTGIDTGIDAGGMDAGSDAGMTDTGVDSGTDAGMTDTGVDSGTDAGMADTGVDSGTDAGLRCTVEGDCPRNLSCLPSLMCGCPARLNPLDGPSGRSEPLQISEIVPGASGYIELYNNTDAPIDLATTVFQWCSPFSYAPVTGAVVPARGYAMIPFPTGFADTLAGGEVILYRDSGFGTPASVMDFVCWGTNPHGTRISTAVSAMKWTGACAPAITGGALHRRIGTDGVDASDYDTTSPPSGAACTP